MEAGAGWISLASPRETGPGVFEGGSGDEGCDDEAQTLPDKGVTDVLVGVPSPGRSRREGDYGAASSAVLQEMVDERSRSQLVGELDSVLRARPLPPTCEKYLPLESQRFFEDEDNGHMGGAQNVGPSHDATPPPHRPKIPIAENVGSQDLMSELRAQLSMAANEEIFSSDRNLYGASNTDDDDNIVVGCEEAKRDEDRLNKASATG